MKETMEILKDVFYVGLKDYNRRIFDALIPLPQGTSYNSYLIKAERVALIDSVNPGFEELWVENIENIVNLQDIEFVIMNHAEPDHAGAIPFIMERNRKVRLLSTSKGKGMAERLYKIPEERIDVVRDREEIDLGNKRLMFIEAPMLHWPETMFTYLKDTGILFPCDFLGFHTARGFFDDDFQDLEPLARRYYGEIMMPFSPMGKSALKKVETLKINLICPSHGPIHRNPERIMGLYKKWTNQETQRKVIILYVTMWQDVEKMIDLITYKFLKNNIKYERYNLLNSDLGDIASDLVDARAIVFASPTVLGSLHPLGIYGAYLIKLLKPPLKYALLLSSYGWMDAGINEAKKVLSSLDIEIVGEKAVNGPAYKKDLEEVERLTERLIEKLRR